MPTAQKIKATGLRQRTHNSETGRGAHTYNGDTGSEGPTPTTVKPETPRGQGRIRTIFVCFEAQEMKISKSRKVNRNMSTVACHEADLIGQVEFEEFPSRTEECRRIAGRLSSIDSELREKMPQWAGY